jgi:uncharacterized protein (TIGR00106 family)
VEFPGKILEKWRSKMNVIVDLCVVPMGVGVSIAKYVAVCHEILQNSGLKTQLHAYGTNIEGDWDTVFSAIRKCHEELHQMGSPRITTTTKLGTRVDRMQSLEDKVNRVLSYMNV